jgi:hypothetical protein
MTDDRNFYDDEKQDERMIIGWCAYCKEEIHEGDPFVMYKGEMYLRDSFITMNLGNGGEIIGYDSEE